MHYATAIKYHLQLSLEIQQIKQVLYIFQSSYFLPATVYYCALWQIWAGLFLCPYRYISYVNFLILNCFNVCY